MKMLSFACSLTKTFNTSSISLNGISIFFQLFFFHFSLNLSNHAQIPCFSSTHSREIAAHLSSLITPIDKKKKQQKINPPKAPSRRTTRML
jgi:hypothetical protein